MATFKKLEVFIRADKEYRLESITAWDDDAAMNAYIAAISSRLAPQVESIKHGHGLSDQVVGIFYVVTNIPGGLAQVV